jgi:hypothetical protein
MYQISSRRGILLLKKEKRRTLIQLFMKHQRREITIGTITSLEGRVAGEAGLLSKRKTTATTRQEDASFFLVYRPLWDCCCCYTSWIPTLSVYIVTFNTMVI